MKIVWGIFALLWGIAGLLAFAQSIWCFVKNGEPLAYNIGGLLTAILLGPLYWIYYVLARGRSAYCVSQ